VKTLTRADVMAAAAVLEGVANRTPVFTSRALNERVGATVFLKGEHLQRGGAFKFRGAFNALCALDPEARSRGVLTWSSGNHAAGVALAGRLLGIRVTVVMPADAMLLKREATIGYGAEVILSPAAERERVGRQVASERGLAIIPPYDHDDIISGQGTAALELLAETGPLDIVIAPVGGGGLLAGTALAAGETAPPLVYGAEPSMADDAARSLHTGAIVTLERVPMTIADGLRTRFVGERNFAVIRRRVEDIITVTEDEIVDAVRWLWLRMKLLVEPSGAVPLAAILCGRLPVGRKRVGLILSGGNADPGVIGPLLTVRSPAEMETGSVEAG
jgi:threo-3-hydroxy-L-aspartate ammonia-lyase